MSQTARDALTFKFLTSFLGLNATESRTPRATLKVNIVLCSLRF